MKNITLNCVLCAFVLTIACGAEGKEHKLSFKLAPEMIAQKIDEMVGQLVQEPEGEGSCSLAVAPDDAALKETALYFSRMDLTFWPVMTFNIGIFQLNVTPLIRLRFDRKPPRGWSAYHP